MLQTFIITFIFILTFFVFIGVRIIFVKGGRFKGTCASANPLLKNKDKCGACGKKSNEMAQCEKRKDPIDF